MQCAVATLLLLFGPVRAATRSARSGTWADQQPRSRRADYRIDFTADQYTPGAANYTTVIDPRCTWGVWEGWGVSLAWWAHVLGQSEWLADVVFSRIVTTFQGMPLPGLGLNIARYNLGASAWRTVANQSMAVSRNIPPFKQIPGFWLDWLSDDPSSSSWDWLVDPNRSAMLHMAKQRGADHFELFSNSPMWWMLQNHNPSGSFVGVTDNLESWNIRNFARYIAITAEQFKNVRGIAFTSVEPFNEPVSPWWTAWGKQEGCHFGHSLQADVVRILAEELVGHGLAALRIAASDENTYDEALASWGFFAEATRALVGKLNTHGYQYTKGRREELFHAVKGKTLWNSEYSDGSGTCLEMATNLNLDLRWLHPVAWCYWQIVDETDGWGLFQANLRDVRPQIQTVNTKFFVLAQYSRHIRPGMTMIDGGEANTIAAYDGRARLLVLITVNYGKEQWITYDLSKFVTVAGPVTRWCTNTDGGEAYAEHHDLTVGTPMRVLFPRNTIQTLEIEGVDVGNWVFT